MRLPTFWRKAAPPSRSKENQELVAQASPIGTLRGRWYTLGVPLTHVETAFQASQAMSHPVVFRCVNKIAEAVSSISFKVRKVQAEGAEPRKIKDAIEKQIQAVLDKPCDEFTDEHVKYWMAANFAVFGNIPLKIGRTYDGQANAIYPLRNVMSQAVGDQAGRIVGYKFVSGDGPQFQLPSRQFVEGRERNGANTREAWAAVIAKAGLDIIALDNSPTRAAVLPIELFTLLMQRGHETASGAPNKNYIIATDGAQNVAQEDQIFGMLQDSRVGGARSGQVGFLSGSKIDVVRLDNDLSDLHSKIPLDDMARQICGIWGVPVAIMGFGGADNAKYAGNYKEGRSSFYEDTIVPGYAKPIAGGLTQAMCPEGYEIYPDLDSIEAIRDARVKRMQAVGEVAFVTPNEKRKMFDLPPIEGGDVLPAPAAAKPTQGAPKNPTDPEG